MEILSQWVYRSKGPGIPLPGSSFRDWHLKDDRNAAPSDENRKIAIPIRPLIGIPADSRGSCLSPANSSRRQIRGQIGDDRRRENRN